MPWARNFVTDHFAEAGGTAAINEAAQIHFQNWALAHQDGEVITLTVPPGTYAMGTEGVGGNWTRGISKLVISAYGATFEKPDLAGTGDDGVACHFGGEGVQNNSTGYAKIATVAAGATSVTALDATERGHLARFAINTWALLAGLDIQSYWASDYGYPPNWHFFEYVYITGIDAGTGVVTFSAPLRNGYKSTWPAYDFNSAGGPAALWVMRPSWDCDHEILGLTMIQTQSANVNGRKITFRDCIFPDADINVSQNREIAFYSCIFVDASSEVDKLVETVTYDGCTMVGVHVQSSSVENMYIQNGTVISGTLNGTAKNTTISDCSIPGSASNAGLRPGAQGYGACTGTLTVTNTDVGNFAPAPTGPAPMNTCYTMTGGVIACPNGTTIISAANNGGMTRLTVASTVGFVEGGDYLVGTNLENGLFHYDVHIVDATHMDIARPFTVTHTGTVQGGAPVWAVDGAHMMWSKDAAGNRKNQTMFQITDITQDANKIYVHTDLAGTFPTLPTSGGELFASCHFAPVCSFTNVTGIPQVVDLSQATARNRPIYEYSKRTYHGADTTATPAAPTVWGEVVSIKVDVTDPFTGTGPLFAQLDWPFTVPGSATEDRWTVLVNLREMGERIITPGGVTGDQDGDDDLSLGGVRWFNGDCFASPNWTANVVAEVLATPAKDFTVSIEYIADQGIEAAGIRTFTCRFV